MFASVTYTSPKDDSRLKLNFMNGEDCLLCINPRYDECSLVLNSKLGGGWQHQECPSDFTMDKGKPTHIVVSAGANSFDIYADKANYSYRYRDEVTKVTRIQCQGNGTAIALAMGKPLPDFAAGRIVYIHATAPEEETFAIDFVSSSPYNYTTDNMPFHISVRFQEDAVIRNTKTNGRWGTEEREGGMPFYPGRPFVVTVFVQKDGFEVSVDETHFTKYRYRTPLSSNMSVQLRNVPFVQKIEYS